jgi:NADP-dependent 3-hydroxy acid dehydrogenase YdfG
MNSKPIVLVTGATAGIGQATAHFFAQHNYNVIITGRRQDRLRVLSQTLHDFYSTTSHSLCFDIRNQQETETALLGLPPEWQKIDVLINNAGLARGLDPIHEGNTEDWNEMIDTNIKGLLYVSRIVSRWMKDRNHGHIVNIGSTAGKDVYPNGNVYCATKFAVEALTRGMRMDLLPFGIKVSSVCPGFTETEFSEVRFHGDTTRAQNVYKGFQPLSAFDVASVVWFIVSQPTHVNIADVLVMPAAQASVGMVNRNLK